MVKLVLVVLSLMGFGANELSASPAGGASAPYLQYPALEAKHLIIKTYPGIEDVQSDLYEIYMEPYIYDLHAASAIALIQGEGETPVKGELIFVQRNPPNGPVLIKGNITGLPPGKHGLHIHQSGDLRQGCEKLGGHFNPYLLQHGGPSSPLRHVGDLGNVEASEDGKGEVHLLDPIMSLGGPRGVVGRALVVKEEEDDLGKAGTADSVTTGSTGKPLACGVIAYVK